MENNTIITKWPSKREFTIGPSANKKPEYSGERVYIPVRSPMYFTSIQTFKKSTFPSKNVTKPEEIE